MSKKLYPSDITREQFAKIAPILELTRKRTRPRALDFRTPLQSQQLMSLTELGQLKW